MDDYKDAKEILKKMMKEFILGEKIFHIEDANTREFFKSFADLDWQFDDQELFDELIDSGELVAVIGERIDRAKKLKPLILSAEPDKETSTYFNEAVNCWFYGIDTASVILTWSLIEYLLKKRLAEKYEALNNRRADDSGHLHGVLLLRACENNHILNSQSFRKLKNFLEEKRNTAVHQTFKLESDDAYKGLLLLKEIIKSLNQYGKFP